MEGVSNLSLKGGGGVQQGAFLDSGSTGFLWTNGRFVYKNAVSKIARFVWTGPKPAVCC